MFTVHIIHYTHKVNANGTSPVTIQVKKKKRTLANILPTQWNDEKKRVITKSHPNYATINIKIAEEYNRVEQLILNGTFDLQSDFIDYFDNKDGGELKVANTGSTLSFKDLCKLYISSLKSGQSMVSYEPRLNDFIKTAGIGDLALHQITRKHLDKYIQSMVDAKNMRSTMRTKLKIVRFVSSFAEKVKRGVKNPILHEDQLPTPERSFKKKLVRAELSGFKDFKINDDPLGIEVQDMFLLAIYLRGMRIGDVIQLRQDYFQDGRLIYESGKNKKAFNIKLIPDALSIVAKYLDGREYLFTLFNFKYNEAQSLELNMKSRAKHVKDITSRVNKKLKEIGNDAGLTKKISTHIARHTFAKMAIESVKDFNLSMDLIGHSNIKEHQLYIREISEAEDLDAAADNIFS
ncbi:tyrosine-type recombinase/integrase [Mucilaginibacter sp. 10I4]|uniref:tyrosine-type recombinase/integrase n=1 Tax=Mucilaginibacter sp. 10I4 TaxID=3048580 RepID=UPI002B238F41|nr:tyrosine-type recombinase/integrase [Mucilaginibacter sp. 10I4]MEB0262285.1 tyrosine-type recombinase/integrase [Mucilaginibacter sp. 10I4]